MDQATIENRKTLLFFFSRKKQKKKKKAIPNQLEISAHQY